MKSLNLKAATTISLVISGLVWFGVASWDHLDLRNLISFFRPLPHVITALLLVYGVFVKSLWKWKGFKGWLVLIPDLNGTWQGHIKSNWKKPDGSSVDPIPVLLTIRQDFLKISCVMRTGEMTSTSFAAGIHVDVDSQTRQLYYTYTSAPRLAVRDRSEMHIGSMLFNVIGDDDYKLEGEYWTQRSTTGSITLMRRTSLHLDELPSDMQQHPMRDNQ